jgi:hypothetical protein
MQYFLIKGPLKRRLQIAFEQRDVLQTDVAQASRCGIGARYPFISAPCAGVDAGRQHRVLAVGSTPQHVGLGICPR